MQTNYLYIYIAAPADLLRRGTRVALAPCELTLVGRCDRYSAQLVLSNQPTANYITFLFFRVISGTASLALSRHDHTQKYMKISTEFIFHYFRI